MSTKSTWELRPAVAWELVRDGDRRGVLIQAQSLGAALDRVIELLVHEEGGKVLVLNNSGKVTTTLDLRPGFEAGQRDMYR